MFTQNSTALHGIGDKEREREFRLTFNCESLAKSIQNVKLLYKSEQKQKKF